MKLNNINISTLIVNKYINTHNYKCNYDTLPRPFHSLAIMMKGTGILHCKGEIIPIHPEDVFFIPQNCTYRSFWQISSVDKEISFYSMHFSFSTQINDFSQSKNKIQKFNIENTDSFIHKYKKLQECLFNLPSNHFVTASIFFNILSIAVSKMNICSDNDRFGQIKPAIDYLQLNFNSSVPVKYLASLCFLSESRFFTLFKKQTGMSPIRYKNYLKLNQIAQYLLLYPNKSIETISDEFSFSSPMYLIRQFKQQFGKTPHQYRKDAQFYKI